MEFWFRQVSTEQLCSSAPARKKRGEGVNYTKIKEINSLVGTLPQTLLAEEPRATLIFAGYTAGTLWFFSFPGSLHV